VNYVKPEVACQAGVLSWRIELGELGQLAVIGRKDRIEIHLSGGMLKEEPVGDRVCLGECFRCVLDSFIDEERPNREQQNQIRIGGPYEGLGIPVALV
jgi:hypothetical protein